MQTVARNPITEQITMPPLPPGQDVLESSSAARERWLEQAAFALYEARRAEFPDAYPLPWDMASKTVRDDCRYRTMAAHRRGLPFVKDVLVEMIAMNYANLEGWVYPDCDNKDRCDVSESDRAAFAAQRRQNFRHKASQIVQSVWNYLEHDTDTEAQRKQSIDRAGGQLLADRMIVSNWRSNRGIPEVNRG